MQAFKNILIGFLVSFVGSIPLGYLNIVGYQIYTETGTLQLIYYLLGVGIIEAVVVYLTVIFADTLNHNKKLLKFIELFSIVFLLALACIFFFQTKGHNIKPDALNRYAGNGPFLIGILLSCFNFVQLPFWLGWNLYLANGNYIEISSRLKFLYVVGTVVGTFLGMLVFVLLLNELTNDTGFISNRLVGQIIPLIFILMAAYQTYRYFSKHRKAVGKK